MTEISLSNLVFFFLKADQTDFSNEQLETHTEYTLVNLCIFKQR